ncbi:hypothetical protein [Streptomyces kronopolitis]|uniref:hypothetical protein n=1 Tax=Streptomyces kronopolitis TaxID=1612435 RepID=UPI003D958DF0
MGFSAPSAFSRWFRDEFGTSPTAWRAAGGRLGEGAREGVAGPPRTYWPGLHSRRAAECVLW